MTSNIKMKPALEAAITPLGLTGQDVFNKQRFDKLMTKDVMNLLGALRSNAIDQSSYLGPEIGVTGAVIFAFLVGHLLGEKAASVGEVGHDIPVQ